MNELVELLENFWFIRDSGNTDYFRIKHAVDTEMKRFLSEFPGWKLISNNKIIKLEKIPAEAEPFMGIQSFDSKTDYCLLCALLIFLDDIDEGGQFLLSELIEAIEKIVSDVIEVDFTRYTDRKSLVRMLRFAQEMGLLKIYEGSLVNVENDREKEILYENTGVSGYFAVHHDDDISEYCTYSDFENTDKIYSDTDKGIYRTNRVYRRLILQPAMYWETRDNADCIYLKNQRPSISNHLDKYFEGRLEIHNDSAFYMLSEDNCFGSVHPSDKAVSGLVLFICGEIQNDIYNICTIWNNNRYAAEKEKFCALICSCREKYSKGLSKEYREMSDEKLIYSVEKYMIDWKMIEDYGEFYLLCDGVFKTCGRYPKDFDCLNGE